MTDSEKMLETLFKKAIGFTVEEITTEYALDEDGNRRAIKEKSAKKYYPPDISAMKAYIELKGRENKFDNMTDSELKAEKERLLRELEALSKHTTD